MKKKPKRTAKPKAKPTPPTNPSFAEMLSQDPVLSALRTEYASKSAAKRRAAAEWEYNASFANNLFEAAVACLPGSELPLHRWPPGFAALAIDPKYAPALLTVGYYEHASGRKEEGMRLLLQLPKLHPNTKDWIGLIDRAAQALIDADDAAGACRLYQAAVEARPGQKGLISGLGWALGHAGKPEEALPWMEKLLADQPNDPELLNDYGWAMVELGRFDEAQQILEKAARLAPADYDLPANNLEELQQRRKEAAG